MCEYKYAREYKYADMNTSMLNTTMLIWIQVGRVMLREGWWERDGERACIQNWMSTILNSTSIIANWTWRNSN